MPRRPKIVWINDAKDDDRSRAEHSRLLHFALPFVYSAVFFNWLRRDAYGTLIRGDGGSINS